MSELHLSSVTSRAQRAVGALIKRRNSGSEQSCGAYVTGSQRVVIVVIANFSMDQTSAGKAAAAKKPQTTSIASPFTASQSKRYLGSPVSVRNSNASVAVAGTSRVVPESTPAPENSEADDVQAVTIASPLRKFPFQTKVVVREQYGQEKKRKKNERADGRTRANAHGDHENVPVDSGVVTVEDDDDDTFVEDAAVAGAGM